MGLDGYESYQLYDTPGASKAEVAAHTVARTTVATGGVLRGAQAGCAGGAMVTGPYAPAGCLVGGAGGAIGGSKLGKATYDHGVVELKASAVDSYTAVVDVIHDIRRDLGLAVGGIGH